MYLGVHFPGDIIVGILWGAIVGTGVYFIYRRFSSDRFSYYSSSSTQYTKTGYLRSDCDIPVAVLVFTLIYALIKACIL